jgi:hypothetical protein
MNKIRILSILAVIAYLLLSFNAFAGSAPKALRGKIITNASEIKIPGSSAGFVKKMKKQDQKKFNQGDDGKWTIHFIAFFNKALPGEQLGVVVLDNKKEPVAVANVAGAKGQTTLATHITIESTETPKKTHTLQVYYTKAGKPVVLAKKQIILK